MSQGQLWNAGVVAIKRKRGRPQKCYCETPSCKVCSARRYSRERAAGIRTVVPGGGRVVWRAEEDALIGQGHDRVVAIVLGRTVSSVANRRHELGLPGHKRRRTRWPATKPKLTSEGYLTQRLASDDPLIGMARSDG